MLRFRRATSRRTAHKAVSRFDAQIRVQNLSLYRAVVFVTPVLSWKRAKRGRASSFFDLAAISVDKSVSVEY